MYTVLTDSRGCDVVVIIVIFNSVKFQSSPMYKLCPERRRRNTRDKRVGSGVTRALSMPSVCDVTQIPPKTSSAYGLANSKVRKRDEGEA